MSDQDNIPQWMKEQDAKREAATAADVDDESFKVTKQDLIDIVREIRKPSPEEQERLDRVERNRKNMEENRIRQLKETEAMRKAVQDACGHRKIDNVTGQDRGTAKQGQVGSDGIWHGVCSRCGGEFTEDRAMHPESGGVGVSGGSGGFY